MAEDAPGGVAAAGRDARKHAKDRLTRYTAQQYLTAIQSQADGKLGHYRGIDTWVRAAFAKHLVRLSPVLLVGSCDQGYGPWYEAMLNAHGVAPLVTDYSEIVYEFGPMNYARPADVAGPFAAIVSISSFEHSGLGRYGDAIDADGDLKAMQWASGLLKPGGKLFLAVPLGKDKTVGNWHRIYGRERLPKLLDGWNLIDSFGYEEAMLDRDTFDGWEPRDAQGNLLHPDYPEYSPVLVLQPNP